jgi:hypothetical protein
VGGSVEVVTTVVLLSACCVVVTLSDEDVAARVALLVAVVAVVVVVGEAVAGVDNASAGTYDAFSSGRLRVHGDSASSNSRSASAAPHNARSIVAVVSGVCCVASSRAEADALKTGKGVLIFTKGSAGAM